MFSTKHAQFVFDYNADFDSIAELSKKKKNVCYYQTLKDRWESGDTTFSQVDLLVFMIGETQQDHYMPYEILSVEQRIIMLSNEGAYGQTLELCDSLLAIHPLNFTAILHKAFLEDKLGAFSAKESRRKFVLYLDVILGSGDGTYNAPTFVLGPADGQLLIRYVFGAGIGLMETTEDIKGNFLEVLEVLKEGQDSAKMYFNIEHVVRRMLDAKTLKEFEKTYKKDQKKNK